jgi:formylglycine-generating enzyme required for sulfatase activity
MQAGGDRTYPWGPEFDPARATTKESDLGQTTPVHMYPDGKTPEGVWDMAGNVWEWTCDDDGDRSNPWFYLKGGSWYQSSDSATSAARDWDFPLYRNHLIGFRVVVVPISRQEI